MYNLDSSCLDVTFFAKICMPAFEDATQKLPTKCAEGLSCMCHYPQPVATAWHAYVTNTGDRPPLLGSNLRAHMHEAFMCFREPPLCQHLPSAKQHCLLWHAHVQPIWSPWGHLLALQHHNAHTSCNMSSSWHMRFQSILKVRWAAMRASGRLACRWSQNPNLH